MRLVAQALTCIRGGRKVFGDLSFSLNAGEALIVTGRNGAGKSSLLRLIASLVPLAGGSLALEGGDAERTIAEQAHYLGHRDPLKGALSVGENLAFWQDFIGKPASAPAWREALDACGIGHLADLPASYLSAGQKRRLSLARLIASPRPLWLLDEPSSALDQIAQTTLTALMTAHLAQGGLIMAATHGPLGLDQARTLRLGDAAASGSALMAGGAP